MSAGLAPKLLPERRTTLRVEPRHKKRENRRSRPAGFGSRRPCAGSLHNGPSPWRAGRVVHGSRNKRRPPPPRQPCLVDQRAARADKITIGKLPERRLTGLPFGINGQQKICALQQTRGGHPHSGKRRKRGGLRQRAVLARSCM